MKGAWIIVAASMLSYGQTPGKKDSPPTTEKSTASGVKLDTWQKSKDCASQAEKMVAEWPHRTGVTPDGWSNHYSPKYDKCFALLSLSQASKEEKSYPTLFLKSLFDAFEHSGALATTCTMPGHADCVEWMVKNLRDGHLDAMSEQLNGKAFAKASAAEQGKVRTIVDPILKDLPLNTTDFCGINGNAADCTKAATFISEHMKN